ncbi:MAG: hypothetical protein LBB76_03445 [Azoarcus sp.]|nr:hypothetical protein [Azoarcus sp.]
MPSYSDYMARTRRGTAAACLLEVGQLVERYYTKKLSYTGFEIPTTPKMECQKALEDHYDFSFDIDDDVKYKVIADAKDNQVAQDKGRCDKLVLQGNGLKAIEGGTISAASCWAGKASS